MATATIDMLLATYADLSAQELDERITRAKDELGSRLVILGHHYQRDEVVKFADYRGDSLRLSQLAARRPRGRVHRFLRRTLHGGERRHSERRSPDGDSS